MPDCLYRDAEPGDQRHLNRQELCAALNFKPIYRTKGDWTYWDLLPDDVRVPRASFCNELVDAPKQPPSARSQPKEKARPPNLVAAEASGALQPKANTNPITSPPPKSTKKGSWADATEQEEAMSAASKPKAPKEPKTQQEPSVPVQPKDPGPQEPKPTPPPQQHLRPPESQKFLPKESEPANKTTPAKLQSQAPQHPSSQHLPSGQPGSSSDGAPDLSTADRAAVYKPLPTQAFDVDVFQSLVQPGSFTKPYLFDQNVLDRRAQPTFSTPHPQPLKCMIWDRRPWICYFGGNPPTNPAQVDGWWFTMYYQDGGCSLYPGGLFCDSGSYQPHVPLTAYPR